MCAASSSGVSCGVANWNAFSAYLLRHVEFRGKTTLRMDGKFFSGTNDGTVRGKTVSGELEMRQTHSIYN